MYKQIKEQIDTMAMYKTKDMPTVDAIIAEKKKAEEDKGLSRLFAKLRDQKKATAATAAAKAEVPQKEETFDDAPIDD